MNMKFATIGLGLYASSQLAFAASPDGPSQQCLDDAGPPWADDFEVFGDNAYSYGTPAAPLLPSGQCPDPLKEACAEKGAQRAFLEGPVQCGNKGWMCRILQQDGWRNPFYNDRNFAHCNTTDADERDNDGHCHGSDTDNVYGWWVRDHWFRGYAGRLHCCCDWESTKGLVNRCDYRKPINTASELETCRDANEEHNKGYEGTCEAHSQIPFTDPITSGSGQCWTMYNFADPESVPQPKPYYPPTEPPSSSPTKSPTKQPTPATSTGGGFDWGEGCAAGNGAFIQNLPTERAYADVGVIPAGKFNIRVELDSAVDIDITLFDTDDITNYPEGQAVVAWCSGGCNSGVLGMSSTAAQASYKGMTVKYSGYNGVNGQRGREYIEVVGETTTTMMMKAYAYKIGMASVTYSWGESQSACCRGESACGGSFLQPINLGAVVTVGEIPIGKRDVFINLRSDTDVDIQVYDLENTDNFAEGQAIVAWCAAKDCNKGVLSGSTEESAYYPDGRDALMYTYAGYNGQDNQKGHEFIRISGVTNRRLLMTAYGYKAGVANVTYTYSNV